MRKRKKWLLRYVERARQALRLWLEKSDVPVGLRPDISPATKHGFDLIYPQVASELLFHVMVRERYCEINIFVNYRDINWDMLLSIEIDEVRKGSYFTCGWCCSEGKKKYFPSRAQLYADHLWEPFFAWVQENISPDKKVSIFALTGCTWAEVGTLDQVADHTTTRELVHSFSIIPTIPFPQKKSDPSKKKLRRRIGKARIVTSVHDLPIYIPNEEIADNLYQTVKFFTGITPPRNYEHPESLDRASAFITETFNAHGYRPQEQLFTFKGQTYRNIIVSTGPEDAPRLVVGAHYDVCDDQPGADDNASGVAALLELAKFVADKKWRLRHRVDFAAYTLEEPPASFTQFMGSYIHALSLKESGALVKGMIALEMLGYFSDEPGSQKYPPGVPTDDMPDAGDFIAVVGRPQDAALAEQIAKSMKKTRLPTEKLLLPRRIRGVDFSDHWGFWELGFQAVMVTDTAFFRNPHYHQASDTIDTLDFDKMADVVQGLLEVIHDGVI